MQDLIQRITFYFRNEMTHDVEVRIEVACIACVMLACLAAVGWQFYHVPHFDTLKSFTAITSTL